MIYTIYSFLLSFLSLDVAYWTQRLVSSWLVSLDLPSEVPFLINPTPSTVDKSHLIRVCRLFQQLTEPSLYDEINITQPRSYPSRIQPPFHLLLKNMLATPRPFDCVKRVHIHVRSITRVWDGALTSKLSDCNLSRLIDLVRTSGLFASQRSGVLRTLSHLSAIDPWFYHI